MGFPDWGLNTMDVIYYNIYLILVKITRFSCYILFFRLGTIIMVLYVFLLSDIFSSLGPTRQPCAHTWEFYIRS